MWWNISWELKRCLKTLLIVYTCYCVTDAHVFSTSSIPVTVTINKFHPSTPCSTTTGRTKPLFFERVLGLHAKTPFQFDIDKWHELVKCGLFRNLTARTSMAPDGGVVLHVTGDELPSSSLAPEVSVIASLDNPEVVGGVRRC